MDIEVRDLRDEDRRHVRRLRYRIFTADTFEADDDEQYVDDDRRVVAVQGDRVVGHAGAWRFGQFFGGRQVPMAGVAGVVVEAHARGAGAASSMLRRLGERVRDQGDVVAALYPATLVPYRRLGWELAGELPAHTLPTRSLLTIAAPGSPVSLRPGTAGDGPAMQARYLEVARQRDGWLNPDPRYLAYNEADEDDAGPEERWVAEREGELTGYVTYRRESVVGAAGSSNRLRVHELVATDVDTERALWRTLGASWTVWPTVAFRGGTAVSPLHLVQEDELAPDRDAWARWMLRILDVGGAFAARGYPGAPDVAVHLEVEDGWLPANDGRWVIAVADGVADARRGGDGTVRIDIGALSSLYAGYTPAATWRRLGRLVSNDDTAVAALDALLRGPGPTCGHFF
ncbi:MAG TPA: GNAT family N-acetyltransferase [Nitriliruptorales bacterium]